LIITIISIVYSNTLEAPFVFDDKFVIVENPIVKDLGYMVDPVNIPAPHNDYKTTDVLREKNSIEKGGVSSVCERR